MSRTSGLLSRVRARLALAGALEDLQHGAAAGGILLALGVGARALGWIQVDVPTAALAAGAVCLAVPLGGVLFRRWDKQRLAAEADRRLGLAERVSTSLWAQSAQESAGPLGYLVVADAEERAANVTPALIRAAIRPRVLRRPLVIAGAGALLALGLLFIEPLTAAAESPAQTKARLDDENRIAEVARRMAKAAERVADAAKERKEVDLEKVAKEIERATKRLAVQPPPRPVALQKMNELADLAKAAARRRAGMPKPMAGTPEASKASKALAELLKEMAQIGLENLQKDMAELQERLEKGDAGESPPSPDDLRAMAQRIDALRQAMEQADSLGMKELQDKLRTIGNEDLLAQIAEKLREIASKLDQDPNYEPMQGEAGESDLMDLGSMSREELAELLQQLSEMASMEELAEMLRQGAGQASGGRRLRLGGAGGT